MKRGGVVERRGVSDRRSGSGGEGIDVVGEVVVEEEVVKRGRGDSGGGVR